MFERRVIKGVGVIGWFWMLQPMTRNTESCVHFGPFETREAAIAFIETEKVDPYTEDGPDYFGLSETKRYHKIFRKGGPLEWCNPPGPDECSPWGHGLCWRLLDFQPTEDLGPA